MQNRLVRFLIVNELLFAVVVPYTVAIVDGSIVTLWVAYHLGPVSYTAMALEPAICALFYSSTMLQSGDGKCAVAPVRVVGAAMNANSDDFPQRTITIAPRRGPDALLGGPDGPNLRESRC